MKLRLLFIRHKPSGSSLFVSLVSPSLDVDALNASRQDALHMLEASYEIQEIAVTPEHLWFEGSADAKKFSAGLNERRKKEVNRKR